MSDALTIPVHRLQAKNLERADFEIVPIDGQENYEGEIPHRHNFYELMLFTRGGGKHEIDFKEFTICGNSIHLVSPTQVHKLRSTTARGSVVCFKEEFLSMPAGNSFLSSFQFYDFTLFSPVIEIESTVFNELEELVHKLNSNWESDSQVKHEILRSYLTILLLKLKDFVTENGFFEKNIIASVNPKIQEFKKLISTHYLKHYGATQYADLLNISSNYLNALCKKETGRTAIALIHERILLEAKRLLYSTNLSVKEIAHLLHFDTDAYFVRFFKKNVGQTPLEYRNKL
jgi:AraC family transcriptional regulator, transcriptional activator of pobA